MNASLFALLCTLALAVIVPGVLILAIERLGPRRKVAAKGLPYEAGIQRTVGSSRERFSVKFYLVAILFILFDVEAVFLFPWAASFRELGVQGLVEMGTFIAVLFFGYFYVLGRGALRWE
ncbi:MAG: NADH-quinone oxidoreductase subunit A [Candidatus Sericytochromatia bacterium]|nr:NADH-quinone oxidoreductase subunit A [Candidatus Sericytochromatia bacterium]